MRIHVVQKGDTLWKIARQYGISFEDLKRLNAHLANPDYIVPGMEIILPNTGKEAPSKQHVKEGVKEQPMVQQPVKERPVKEQPMKEKPVKEQPRPMPVPQPIQQPKPQPQFMMPPIELHWTHQAQPAPQPMNIDFFNMAPPAPNVNVQLDATQFMPAPQPPMMIPMPMPMPMPQPVPQPKPEPEKAPAPEPKTITQYVPVQVPVPVPVPHYIHPPCGCMHHHKKPCGCMHHQHHQHHQHHPMPMPMPMPMPQQMPTTESGGCGCGGQNYPMEQFPMTQQPYWGTMPAEMHGDQMLTPDMAGAQMAQHQEGMQGQMDLQMPHMNMQQNIQGEEMAGWAFPESSSFPSSSFLGGMNQAGAGINQMHTPNINQQWGPGPALPMQNQQMLPYQQGWPTNPWMMPYS